MRFTDPLYLLLVLPVVAGLYWSWRHVHGMAKNRKRLAFAVRLVLVALCLVALSGPQAVRPNQGLATMFVIDWSDSVTDEDKQAAVRFVGRAMETLGPEDVAGVVVAGVRPVLETAVGGRRPFRGIQSKVDGSGTDLAAAVRLAAATLPEGHGRRIVVLSDGNENRGDLAQAAEVASTERVPIDTVTLGTRARRAEASVLELRTPNEVRADEPFQARVVVESTIQQPATLVIDRDGTVVARQQVVLDAGKSSFTIDQKLAKAGFFRYRASLEVGRDSDNRNNLGASFTAVKGKPKVLVLQGDPSKMELTTALRSHGVDVDHAGPSQVPVRPEELQRYDAVILNDLNAMLVTEGQMKILQSAVRDTGIGLAMVGGENSFLPGGWYGTPVAEALPVDLNIRQRKSFPSTSVLVVVDASGSMGATEDGVQKIQLAAKAAEETVKLLSPLDRISVVGSTDGIEAVAPMQELKDKDSVIRQIRRLRPGSGGIYAQPSVKYADRILRAENTRVRHHIFLGDGADVDDYGQSLAVISQMRSDKITTSVVAIGDGKDVPFLKAMAAAGGGNFYLATKASKLPAIFTQDVAVMSRSAIEEVTFVPEMKLGEEMLRGFVPSDFPALFAYCLADARPLARVGLVSPKRDPILASWQYGLGTSLAFMSDAQARWASRWVGWDGFGRFWAQGVRVMSRKSATNNYEVNVDHEGGKGVVDLRATDRLGNPVSASEVKVTVSSPNGESQDVVLTQEAPGQFSGSFAASELGSYIVSVAESAPNGSVRVNASGFSVPYPPEYRTSRSNTALLAQVAETSRGAELKDPSQALRPITEPGETIKDIWMWFVLAAAVMLPFDVGVRRIALPLREALAKVWQRFVRRQRPESVPNKTIDRLRVARDRVAPTIVVSPPLTPKAPTSEGVERAKPKAPTAPGSTAAALLEKRRKRQEGDPP